MGIPVWGPWGSFKGSWVNLKGPHAISSCQLAGGWGESREAKSPTEAPYPAPAADVRSTVLAGPRCRLRVSGPGSWMLLLVPGPALPCGDPEVEEPGGHGGRGATEQLV